MAKKTPRTVEMVAWNRSLESFHRMVYLATRAREEGDPMGVAQEEIAQEISVTLERLHWANLKLMETRARLGSGLAEFEVVSRDA